MTTQARYVRSWMLAAADPDPALVGIARRGYRQAGRLRVHGVCSEPVISATGYGGVVTHLVSDDGRWFSVADIKPGGPARARRAATAAVAPGTGSLTHARLSRGGMLMAGATVSADGRLGSGKGVRATPATGLPWTEGPLAALFSRPLSEAVAERLPPPAASDPEDAERRARALIGCDLILVGVAGDRLFARELPTGQPDVPGILLSLTPSSSHPDLCHVANFRRVASRPGLRLRVIGRLDADRAVTIRPLAVAPVPDGEATLRLPAEWAGHADLGYDRLEGMHLPPPDALSSADRLAQRPTDPVADTPLWRLRRTVEAAVAGGRRTVAEPSRSGDGGRAEATLRGSGFRTAAELLSGLVTEADRTRDVFGRADEPDPDRYARAWLAAAVHLAATERALVQAGWQPRHPTCAPSSARSVRTSLSRTGTEGDHGECIAGTRDFPGACGTPFQQRWTNRRKKLHMTRQGEHNDHSYQAPRDPLRLHGGSVLPRARCPLSAAMTSRQRRRWDAFLPRRQGWQSPVSTSDPAVRSPRPGRPRRGAASLGERHRGLLTLDRRYCLTPSPRRRPGPHARPASVGQRLECPRRAWPPRDRPHTRPRPACTSRAQLLPGSGSTRTPAVRPRGCGGSRWRPGWRSTGRAGPGRP